MFVSVNHLHQDMGVDPQIARFFVDRKVPAGNAFWRKRLLYVGRGTGFVSIPVYYDILYRIGVPREILLSEEHIRLMEQVMHYAILQEYKEISFEQQLTETQALFSGKAGNEYYLSALLAYLRQPVLKPLGPFGKNISALNRADAFLFVPGDLPLNREQQLLAIAYWYPLHTSYLLMDDLVDLQEDEKTEEENSILEMGGGEESIEKGFRLLDENAAALEKINKKLSEYILVMKDKVRKSLTEKKIH